MAGIFGDGDNAYDDLGGPSWQSFQDQVEHWLRNECYPSQETYEYVRDRDFRVGQDGKTIRPDIVVFIPASPPLAVCVAEAKDVDRLDREHVIQVAEYREALEPEATYLAVKMRCAVSTAIERFAEEFNVEIVKFKD